MPTASQAGTRRGLLRNIASNWVVLVVNLITTFVVTPLVVQALGQERYGVWSFLNGLVGYSSLFYLGAGSALVKHIAASAAHGDEAAINRLASVTLTIFGGLGLLTFVVFAGMSPWMPTLIAGEYTATAAWETSVACALLGVQSVFSFLTAGYAATLIGRDRFDLANLGRVAATLLRFAVIVLAVRGDQPFVRLMAYLTAGSVVEFLGQWALAHAADPALRIRPTRPRAADLRILYQLALPALVITVATRLIYHTDTTVIGVMLGAVSVGIYALPQQLMEHARITVSTYAGVLLARLAALHAQGQTAAMQTAYLRCARVTAFAAAFVVANLIWFGVPFLELWAGPGFGTQARWVIVWLALAVFFSSAGVIVSTPFYDSMHRTAWPAAILVGEAAVNLGLSVALARPLGIEGVALGTLVPAVLGYLLVPRRMCAALGLPVRRYLAATLVPASAVALGIAAVQWPLARWLPADTVLSFVVRAAMSLPPALAVAVLISTDDERESVRGVLTSLSRRLGRR
jgi:O-antigen/teichoic acid export membrane protein